MKVANYNIIKHYENTEGEHFVIGHNPEAVKPYATWAYNGLTNCYWGHYKDTMEQATEDVINRLGIPAHALNICEMPVM